MKRRLLTILILVGLFSTLQGINVTMTDTDDEVQLDPLHVAMRMDAIKDKNVTIDISTVQAKRCCHSCESCN